MAIVSRHAAPPPNRVVPRRTSGPRTAARGMMGAMTAAALAVAACIGLVPEARAGADFVQGLHSRVRLVPAGSLDGARLAGIEIVLDGGFKTYWRQPGEAGLPPRFDWGGSTNLRSAEVLWPAPRRVEDAGGVSYVYEERVVLPVRVIAADAAKPVELRLGIDYGVCKAICIPARAELAATVASEAGAREKAFRRLVEEEGLKRLPKPKPLGAPGPLSIRSITPAQDADKPAYVIAVGGPADATLFAEGPDDWYISTTPPAADGQFKVVVEEKPKEAKGPASLRLTLVSGEEAIETEVPLDEKLRPR